MNKTNNKNTEHVHESNGLTFSTKESFGESIGSTFNREALEKIEKAIHDFLHTEDEAIEKKSVSLYTFLESKGFRDLKLSLKNNADYFMLGYVWHATKEEHNSIDIEIGGKKKSDLITALLLKSLISSL